MWKVAVDWPFSLWIRCLHIFYFAVVTVHFCLIAGLKWVIQFSYMSKNVQQFALLKAKFCLTMICIFKKFYVISSIIFTLMILAFLKFFRFNFLSSSFFTRTWFFRLAVLDDDENDLSASENFSKHIMSVLHTILLYIHDYGYLQGLHYTGGIRIAVFVITSA